MYRRCSHAAMSPPKRRYASFDPSNLEAIHAFVKDRWFKRSWTLQELLAPALLVIYNSDFLRLGTKQDLALILSFAWVSRSATSRTLNLSAKPASPSA